MPSTSHLSSLIFSSSWSLRCTNSCFYYSSTKHTVTHAIVFLTGTKARAGTRKHARTCQPAIFFAVAFIHSRVNLRSVRLFREFVRFQGTTRNLIVWDLKYFASPIVLDDSSRVECVRAYVRTCTQHCFSVFMIDLRGNRVTANCLKNHAGVGDDVRLFWRFEHGWTCTYVAFNASPIYPLPRKSITICHRVCF